MQEMSRVGRFVLPFLSCFFSLADAWPRAWMLRKEGISVLDTHELAYQLSSHVVVCDPWLRFLVAGLLLILSFFAPNKIVI